MFTFASPPSTQSSSQNYVLDHRIANNLSPTHANTSSTSTNASNSSSVSHNGSVTNSIPSTTQNSANLSPTSSLLASLSSLISNNTNSSTSNSLSNSSPLSASLINSFNSIPNPQLQNPNSTGNIMPICRNFELGRCTKGESCRYAHISNSNTQTSNTPPGSSTPPQQQQPAPNNNPSNVVSTGNTKPSTPPQSGSTSGSSPSITPTTTLNSSGELAVTATVVTGNGTTITAAGVRLNANGMVKTNTKNVCWDWVAGRCERGGTCKYVHQQPNVTGNVNNTNNLNNLSTQGILSLNNRQISGPASVSLIQLPATQATPTNPSGMTINAANLASTNHSIASSPINTPLSSASGSGGGSGSGFGDAVCHQFQKSGRCMYGETCKFAHVTPGNNPNLPINNQVNNQIPANSSNLVNNAVNNGPKQNQVNYDQQTLNLIISGGTGNTVQNNGFNFSIHNIPNTINGQEVCRFYAKTGRCKYGAACKFVHINGGGLGNSNLVGQRHHHQNPNNAVQNALTPANNLLGNNVTNSPPVANMGNNVSLGANSLPALNSDAERNNILNIASNQLPAGISREVLATLLNSLTPQQLASLTQLAQQQNTQQVVQQQPQQLVQVQQQQSNANNLLLNVNRASNDGLFLNKQSDLFPSVQDSFGLSGFNLSKTTSLLPNSSNNNNPGLANNALNQFNQYKDLLGNNNQNTQNNYRPILSATTGSIPAVMGLTGLNALNQNNQNRPPSSVGEFDDEHDVDLLLPKDLKEDHHNGLGLSNNQAMNNSNNNSSNAALNLSSLNDALPSLTSYMQSSNPLQLERSTSLNSVLPSHLSGGMNGLMNYRSTTTGGNLMDLLSPNNPNFAAGPLNLLNSAPQNPMINDRVLSAASANNLLNNDAFSAGAFSTGFGRSLTSYNAPKHSQTSLQATIANTLQNVSSNANVACLKCGSTPSVYNQGFRSLCWRCCPCIHCGDNEGKAVCAIGLCEACYTPFAGDRLR